MNAAAALTAANAQPMTTEIMQTIREWGCMYHKDDDACPVFPSTAYYRVEGDVWCAEGLAAFRAEGLRVKAVRIV